MYKYSYCFNMRLNFPKNERSNNQQQQQLTSAPISSFSLRGDPCFLPLQLQPFHFNGVSCSIFYQNFNINTEENEMIMISGTKKSDSKDWRDLRRRGMQLFEWVHAGQIFFQIVPKNFCEFLQKVLGHIHCYKSKVARNEKWINLYEVSYSKNMANFEAFH